MTQRSPLRPRFRTPCRILTEVLLLVVNWIFEHAKRLFHVGTRDGRNRIPPITSPIVLRSASDLARMIVFGEVN